MTISATTQGLRPGVCTSSNRPATPFEGQMIYETDTDLTYVYGGSAWQQVAGGTAVGNSGLVYIGSFSNSNTTSLDITGIGATYDFYRLVGFLPVGSAPLTFQLYDGATARNSAAYYTAGFKIAAIVGSLTAVTNNGSTSANIFAGNLVANASFQMDFRYGGAGAYSSWSHFGTNIGNGETEHRSGAYHLNASADRIKLASTSNFSATVVLYGYRK